MLQDNQPLYLPEGSIRAILAIGLVSAFIFLDVQLEVTLMVLGFYFGSRAAASSKDERD